MDLEVELLFVGLAKDQKLNKYKKKEDISWH